MSFGLLSPSFIFLTLNFILMGTSPTFLHWSFERDDTQTYGQVGRLADRQYPLKMMIANNR